MYTNEQLYEQLALKGVTPEQAAEVMRQLRDNPAAEIGLGRDATRAKLPETDEPQAAEGLPVEAEGWTGMRYRK